MPRRLILSATERDTLLALPESQDDLIRYYTFNDSDLSLIRQRRGDANRLGFAVQLCLLRYPGYALGTDSELPEPVILWVAKQVQADPASWAKYGERDVTRREHAQELRTYLQLAPFGLSDFRALVRELTELAQQTDKGLLLAGQALESLRQKRRILPALSVIDRACSEAIARANRRVYRALVEPLTDSHRAKLYELLKLKAGSSITWLTWLRQAPLKPNSRHMLEHIERLKTFQLVGLPEGLGRHIHQNRLLKLAREGGQMTPKDLGKFEPQRRYATLAAVVLESTATVIDELVDLHDRILVKLFSGAKHKHQQQFQKQGKAINDKVRLYSKIGQALLEAKEAGSDPYAAIEAVIPWDEFTESVSEAELLARPEGFDHLHLVGENFASLRRYTPALLDVLELRAAPAAQGVLAAVQTLRQMNADNLRKVPADAPTAFIKPRWKPLVITPEGLDRRFYEICALSELKNALRSGDIWVKGSRQFRDFDDYLLPAEKFAALKREQALPLAINPIPSEVGYEFGLNSSNSPVYTINGMEYSPDDVLHMRGFGLDGIKGLSRLTIGRNILSAQYEADVATMRAFKQGLKVGGFFKIPVNAQDMDDAQFNQFMARMSRFSNPENQSKWMPLPPGMEPVTTGNFRISPVDVELLNSRYFGIEEICRLFNTPPPMIGHTSKASSWASSTEQLNLHFLTYSIMPTLVRREKTYWHKLLTPVERKKLRPQYRVDDLSRVDLKTRQAFFASGLQNGYLSQNDVREMIQRTGIGPEGDEYRVQLNMANAEDEGKDDSEKKPVAPKGDEK